MALDKTPELHIGPLAETTPGKKGEAFSFSQNHQIWPLRNSICYAIRQADWEDLKSKISRITVSPNFYHSIGHTLIGFGISTFVAMLTGQIPPEKSTLSLSIFAVAIISGLLSLLFSRTIAQITQERAQDILSDMVLIEERHEVGAQ